MKVQALCPNANRGDIRTHWRQTQAITAHKCPHKHVETATEYLWVQTANKAESWHETFTDCEPEIFFPSLSVCQSSSASVSMFFRNDSKVEPYPVQLPGCSLDCPLDEFVRITKPSVSEDRDKECQVPSEGRDRGELSSHTPTRNSTEAWMSNHYFIFFLSLSSEVIISLIVAGCLLLLLIALLLGVICWQKEPISNRGYHHVINQEVQEESWQKQRLLLRRDTNVMLWDSSDEDGLWNSWVSFLIVLPTRRVRDPHWSILFCFCPNERVSVGSKGKNLRNTATSD